MAQEQKVAVEDVQEAVETTTTPTAEETMPAVAPEYKREPSAAEKKARKAMQKKGLEQVPGITNITIMRKKAGMFSIYAPDVYKNSTSDTWIVFGEARMDNFGRPNPAFQRAARTGATADAASTSATATAATEAAPEAAADAASASSNDVDEARVDSKDVELIMSQANCTRAQAIESLIKNGNDVVNSIMELTIN
ncbi:hypothetical protein LPJ64_001086 [Coemansia asiatica]|uniref:Nascent polypeptide-associated complex subunit alpha n=1 Tax=Coemansia asiatica TaxID=1052880 RepID=A0A9W7XQQ3_9FUNG|nr:hypothetical protein LPJ64_001086 [Coemansia asiatica]KAJ2889013.1 hypothetical protein FB639_000213 [Coemansia asiatica]